MSDFGDDYEDFFNEALNALKGMMESGENQDVTMFVAVAVELIGRSFLI